MFAIKHYQYYEQYDTLFRHAMIKSFSGISFECFLNCTYHCICELVTWTILPRVKHRVAAICEQFHTISMTEKVRRPSLEKE